MNKPAQNQIDELVQVIRSSKKYEAISEELIRSVGLRELAVRRNLKEATKATKNKLHQVAGAFFDTRPPYDEWLAQLAAARPENRANDNLASQSPFRQTCLAAMRLHASTRERLPMLEPFYRQLFAALPPIHSVLDLACGLNPLAIPWMPLAPGASYYACDLYADMIAFLNDFFAIAGIAGQAEVCDLVGGPPRRQVDLALVFKTLPTLDQLAKDAGRDLLRALDARFILVSFPARSLGGHNKGMAEQYEARFRALAAAEAWPIERFAFASELVFLVRTEDRGSRTNASSPVIVSPGS